MDKFKTKDLENVSGGAGDLDSMLNNMLDESYQLLSYEKYQLVFAPNGKTLQLYCQEGDPRGSKGFFIMTASGKYEPISQSQINNFISKNIG